MRAPASLTLQRKGVHLSQVREDWLYSDEGGTDRSDKGDSEDSNAEDWYGNDYPAEESSGESSSEASYDRECSSDD